MTRRRLIYTVFSSLAAVLLFSSQCDAQTPEGQDYRIVETVISAKAPKRLRSYVPFWGTPEPSAWTREDTLVVDSCVASIDTSRVFPNWICWNLDLASTAADKYKFRRFIRKGERLPVENYLVRVIDECYRWAWRKPYGNTSIVVGPIYSSRESRVPYACFVAVCKKESTKGLMPLGFTSVAFIIPASPSEMKNLYDRSCSVNFVEYRTGFNLFPELPRKVQEQVEEMTAYELFCPFQEIDENDLEFLEPEFDHGDVVEDLQIQ